MTLTVKVISHIQILPARPQFILNVSADKILFSIVPGVTEIAGHHILARMVNMKFVIKKCPVTDLGS